MRHFLAVLLPIGVALGGCSTLLWQTGVPGSRAELRVERVDRRGPFIDVHLTGDALARRFFVRATDTCTEMLRRDRIVTSMRTEGLGPLVDGDHECSVAGIGDLESLRRSRRGGSGFGKGTSQRRKERIEIVFTDEEYLYARGGFTLGGRFGWRPGTDQVVALLPLVPECSGLVDGGFVTTQYREVGTPAFGILDGNLVCPIRGIIAVQPGDFAPPLR
jgi:hypothetical protein